MDGLSLLGVDKETLKKNAPYIGGGVGALIGVLVTMFTGKHSRGLGGHALLFGRRVPRLVRVGVGMVAGAAAGGAVGYGVRRGTEGSTKALPAGPSPKKKA